MSSGTSILRSPHEAASIYNLGGAKAPRQHHMFAVCFHKAGASTAAGGTWASDLSFLVKSVDRPSIEPKIEEVNQYNKKRLVQTGYKIGPTRMTIYDTADSTAMRMFAEYSKYYFGDFRHASTETDWNSDVIQNTFNGADTGYGFAPQAASTGSDEYNAQFFFDSVSVYQVWGGKFVQYDLIRPRISSFNPDELDYSNGEVSLVQMTLQCEAVVYINDFQPQPISSDSFLSEAFGNTSEFNGDVVDYPSSDSSDPSTTNNYSNFTPSSYSIPVNNVTATAPALQTADTGVSSGTLAPYGVYNFGSTTAGAITTAPTQSLASDLSQVALANPLLSTALNLSSVVQAAPDPTLSSPYVQPPSISQDTLDQATAAIQAAGLQGGTLPDSNFSSALIYGAIAAGAAAGLNGREMVFNRALPSAPAAYAANARAAVRQYDPVLDQQTYPIASIDADGTTTVTTTVPGQVINSWNSANGQGLSLSPYAYGVVNAQRSSTAQIGVNTRTSTPYNNRFGASGYTYPKSF